jgi:hypothetical protein
MMRYLIEIVLALITLYASMGFWQLRKRKRFGTLVSGTPALLERFITRELLTNPPANVRLFAGKGQFGYVNRLTDLVLADVTSQRQTSMLLAAVLGVTYLALNIALCFLPAFIPVLEETQLNAIEHILAIAVIIDQWRRENATECEELMGQSLANFRPIFDVVKRAY